jgi:hypothetical protein
MLMFYSKIKKIDKHLLQIYFSLRSKIGNFKYKIINKHMLYIFHVSFSQQFNTAAAKGTYNI